MSRETENPETDFHRYEGRWIATLNGRVIADGNSRIAVAEQINKLDHQGQQIIRFVAPPDNTQLHDLINLLKPALPAAKPLYLVGGAVRDHLLKRPIKDLDFVTEGDGIPVARQVANYLGGEFYRLDQTRGTGRVLLYRSDNTRLILDFAAMRGPDLLTDLNGRDFTINAIAINAHDPNEVFDPLSGALDIREKRLKICTEKSFVDDPLRVLRAIRIANSFGFQMTAGTRSLLRESKEKLENVSPERQRDEIIKILGGRRPAAALRAMHLLGLIEIVFPELAPMKGVKQSPPHVHDVWEHTMALLGHLERLLGLLANLEHDPEEAGSLYMGLAVMRLGRYRSNIHKHIDENIVPDRSWRALLFLAALYHDSGKPAVRSLDETGRIRFLKHEKISGELIEGRAKKLVLSNDEIFRLRTIARHHMRPHFLVNSETLPTRRATYRFFRDTEISGVDICLISLADILATQERSLSPELWRKYLDIVRTLLENWWEKPTETVQPSPLLTGNDLISKFHLKPGPKIGKLLAQLQEAQAVGEINNLDDAITFVNGQLDRD